MSDYMVEAGASARARARRRRALVTLLVVVLALFGAFWFAWSYWKKPPEPATAGSTPTCTTVKALTRPSRLNVYNATSRNGLAASTAAELKKRGFVIGAVANDPLKRKITAAAEVRYGTSGKAAVQSVLALVARPVKLADSRKDASVDLVIGNGFKALAPIPTPTSTLPACTPTATPRTTPRATPAKKPSLVPTTTR